VDLRRFDGAKECFRYVLSLRLVSLSTRYSTCYSWTSRNKKKKQRPIHALPLHSISLKVHNMINCVLFIQINLNIFVLHCTKDPGGSAQAEFRIQSI